MNASQKSLTATRVFAVFFLLIICCSLSVAQQPPVVEARAVPTPIPPTQPPDAWTAYGGDPGGSRYSAASQITRENVAQLKVAWTFHTGASQLDTQLIRKAAFESTPILFDNKLFLTSPYDKVFALDPATGEKIWEFDPNVDLSRNYSEVTSRGVSAWRDSKGKPGARCALRIFL